MKKHPSNEAMTTEQSSSSPAPLYIAFEGGEGSGKSTQADVLAQRIGAVLTREPGGTPLGQDLRRLLLNPGEAPIGPRAETLLMAADRAQHVVELVQPALATGRTVISDRTAFSSLAYQGGGRQLGLEEVRSINDWALGGCWPDLVVFLDCDPQAAQARLGGSLDRLEQEGVEFHRRVYEAYQTLAGNDPERWITVSAAGTIDEVAIRVWDALVGYLPEERAS